MNDTTKDIGQNERAESLKKWVHECENGGVTMTNFMRSAYRDGFDDARAQSPAPASPSGEDAAEQSAAPVAGPVLIRCERPDDAEAAIWRWKTSWGGWTYRKELPAGWHDLASIEAYRISSVSPLPRASEPPYSAPFTTDVPQCCGDPDTCNDPCSPRASEQADEAVTELQNIVNAKRFDRDTFANDTEFADWVQSRARHTLGRAKEPK